MKDAGEEFVRQANHAESSADEAASRFDMAGEKGQSAKAMKLKESGEATIMATQGIVCAGSERSGPSVEIVESTLSWNWRRRATVLPCAPRKCQNKCVCRWRHPANMATNFLRRQKRFPKPETAPPIPSAERSPSLQPNWTKLRRARRMCRYKSNIPASNCRKSPNVWFWFRPRLSKHPKKHRQPCPPIRGDVQGGAGCDEANRCYPQFRMESEARGVYVIVQICRGKPAFAVGRRHPACWKAKFRKKHGSPIRRATCMPLPAALWKWATNCRWTACATNMRPIPNSAIMSAALSAS